MEMGMMIPGGFVFCMVRICDRILSAEEFGYSISKIEIFVIDRIKQARKVQAKMPDLLWYGLTLVFSCQFKISNEFVYLRWITYVWNSIEMNWFRLAVGMTLGWI